MEKSKKEVLYTSEEVHVPYLGIKLEKLQEHIVGMRESMGNDLYHSCTLFPQNDSIQISIYRLETDSEFEDRITREEAYQAELA